MSDPQEPAGDVPNDGGNEISIDEEPTPQPVLKKTGHMLFGQSLAVSPSVSDEGAAVVDNVADGTSNNNGVKNGTGEAGDDARSGANGHRADADGDGEAIEDIEDESNAEAEDNVEASEKEAEKAAEEDESIEVKEEEAGDDADKATPVEEKKKEADPVDKVVEEECVKKIVSMDTEDKPEPAAVTEEKAEEKEEEIGQKEGAEEEKVLQTPRRGRPPKGSTPKGTPRSAKKPVEKEEIDAPEQESSRRSTRGSAVKMEEQTPKVATPRGRRGSKKEEADEKEEEVEKSSVRSRRSLKSQSSSPSKSSARGKEAEEKDDEESNASPRRGRRSVATAATVATPEAKKATPAHGGPLSAAKEAETPVTEKKRRGRPPKNRSAAATPSTPTAPTATPTSRSRRAKASESTESKAAEDEEAEEAETDEGEKKTPSRRGRGRKSAAATPAAGTPKRARKGGDDDPYDMDTEFDKHPEPLKHITVDKGSFGEVNYTRTPSSAASKYARTEQSASARVGSLGDTPIHVAPRTITSASSTRKSLGGSQKRERKSAGRKSYAEDDDEDMDVDAANEPTPGRRGRGPGKRKAEENTASAKRPALTVEIPELNAEEQWSADHPEDEHVPLVSGARVFAAYGKMFYPALVGDRDGLGRYNVRFVEDGVMRPVPPAGVVPLCAITIDKDCMITEEGAEETTSCRVIKSPNAASAAEWLVGMFQLVETGGEQRDFELPWTRLSLDMSTQEWKKYVKVKSSQATKIAIDNIASIQDRRERRSRVSNDAALANQVASSTPESSIRPARSSTSTGGSRRGRYPRTPAAATPTAAAATPAAESTPAAAGSIPKKRGRKPKVAVTEENKEAKQEKEAEKEEELPTLEKEEPVAPRAAAAPAAAVVAEEEDTRSSRIFLGKTFILTSANRSGADGVTFKKNEMKKNIQDRGGFVLDDIAAIPLDADAYLISDTHYRTHKYLAAMARAMPCVSHKWVMECVKQEKLIDHNDFVLAGGQGILDGVLYPLPKERGVLLKNQRVMVHSRNDSANKKGSMTFKQIWEPIVRLLGATIVPDEGYTAANIPAMDIVLTDSSAAPDAVLATENKGIPVVSSEWLIQAIIMSKCPDSKAHHRFRYDSGNEPKSAATSQQN